jgi:hypothetical protein
MSAKLLFEMADLLVEKQLAVWVRKERRGRYRAIVPGPGCHALLQNSATLDMRLAKDIYPSEPTEVVEILRRACLHGRLAYVQLNEWETIDLIFRR